MLSDKFFYIIIYIFFVIGLSIVIEWVCNKENFVNTNSLDAILEKVLKEKKEQIKKEFIEKIKGYTIDEYADFLFKPAEKKVNTLEGINYTTDYMNIEDFGNIKKDDNFMKKFAQMKIPKLMY